MDEEGYPLPGTDARLISANEELTAQYTTAVNISKFHKSMMDKESGEKTDKEVVVLRSAPRDDGDFWTELAFLNHSQGSPHMEFLQYSLNRRTLYMHRSLLATTDFTTYQNRKVPPHFIHSSTHPFTVSKEITKVPFRIPLPQTEVRSTRNTNKVTISIWREFCRGPQVYEDTAMEWQALRNECILWPHLQTLFGDFAKFVPSGVMWLIRIMLCMLKICKPWMGLQLVYFHLLYIHIKLHLKGEKRGVEPIFVGTASQGPIIYSIRHFSCPYCRHNKQSKDSLRYFEKLRQERRDMAVR